MAELTGLRDLYKCSVCGHVVEIFHEGAPTLVCCGQPMNKLEAKTRDEGKEKHVPVVEETADGIKVTVGSTEHPMEEKHYIKFIEVQTADKVIKAELKPGMKPSAGFCVKKADVSMVREYCIVHDLWMAK